VSAGLPATPGNGVWPEAVVLGVSAGAVDALSAILPTLPKAYALPIMVVVHLPPDKNSAMTQLLAAKCEIAIREAEDKEPIVAGTVYVAPPDYHLLVERGRYLSLSSDEPVHHSRPSIDVLFESAAEAYGTALVGIVLTGASRDGADGLRKIRDGSGIMIVQNPAEALASAMPQAALEACPEALVMSLEQIAGYLRNLRSAR
jgi:two-component system chemotaxis response regulator CheB